jgi:hypothetical protein
MDRLQPLSDVCDDGRRREQRHARKQPSHATIPFADDDTFWIALEEREEGRAALEADHLFDTSFDCAL